MSTVKPRVLILTGTELRHTYFRQRLSSRPDLKVVGSVCEGTEKSLLARATASGDSDLLVAHAVARQRMEEDYFGDTAEVVGDSRNTLFIEKGLINEDCVFEFIDALAPDLIACYGSSIIGERLIRKYRGRFINVHLGLSPYYRGAGTNIWPIINKEPSKIGVTFMHIDQGIDTGRVIHQLVPSFVLGDTHHTVGMRLIRDTVAVYGDLLASLPLCLPQPQIIVDDSKLYRWSDFDKHACALLYSRISEGVIDELVLKGETDTPDIIQQPHLLPVE